MGHQKAPAKNR